MRKNGHQAMIKTGPHGSLKSYLIGFIISIILTLLAFYLVAGNYFNDVVLDSAIVSLGVIQAFVQLFFFLHLGEESEPRWNFMAFLFMAGVIVILVAGTLWIMYHLDYRTEHIMNADPEGVHSS